MIAQAEKRIFYTVQTKLINGNFEPTAAAYRHFETLLGVKTSPIAALITIGTRRFFEAPESEDIAVTIHRVVWVFVRAAGKLIVNGDKPSGQVFGNDGGRRVVIFQKPKACDLDISAGDTVTTRLKFLPLSLSRGKKANVFRSEAVRPTGMCFKVKE